MTLVHELLHAISAFANVPELLEHVLKYKDRLETLIEGLTEFLTGYIPYLKYHDRYTV